jgi:hypothetical protein
MSFIMIPSLRSPTCAIPARPRPGPEHSCSQSKRGLRPDRSWARKEQERDQQKERDQQARAEPAGSGIACVRPLRPQWGTGLSIAMRPTHGGDAAWASRNKGPGGGLPM